jgi:hypothetical protein
MVDFRLILFLVVFFRLNYGFCFPAFCCLFYEVYGHLCVERTHGRLRNFPKDRFSRFRCSQEHQNEVLWKDCLEL